MFDFQELYRCLIYDYLIERCQKLHRKDFVLVTDFMMRLRMGKRIHLCEFEADNLARARHGSRQKIDTLIDEEAFGFANFLRHERETWIPRIASLT